MASDVLQSVETPHSGWTAMTPVALDPLEFLSPPRERYFKRYRMEIDLAELPGPVLPHDFSLLGWHANLLDPHAEALYSSFFQGVDTIVFPSLGDREGCRCLMLEIAKRPGFEPWATW